MRSRIVLFTSLALLLLIPSLALYALPDGDAPEAAPQAEEETPFAASLYGFLKLDAAYDSTLVSTGNFIRWVESASRVDDDPHFNLTARQTRFGLRLSGPNKPGLEVTGRFEIDFYGGGAENKNLPMLRHGYLQLAWPDKDLTILAGQTSDVISPLVPTTLNYTVAWWGGNIGYRRPQLRVTKGFAAGDDGRVELTAALTRTVGDQLGFEAADTGTDAGFPTAQGRLAYSWSAGGRQAGIGVWGHVGEEELGDLPVRGDAGAVRHVDLSSWSTGVDVLLPIGDSATLRAEAWTGENVDDYLGGIAQGINVAREIGIRSRGGWVAIDFDTSDDTTVSFGGSIDDPEDEDLGLGARTLNQAIWGNFVWSFHRAVRTGIELQWWKTEYKGLEDGDAMRVQSSVIYSF
jgi:hypothetical protein